MVTFNHVGKHYGTRDVLEDVSCEILPGRKIGLVGPNGAGKTTFVRLLAGDEEPSSGSVVRAPGLHYWSANVNTDSRRAVVVGGNVSLACSDDGDCDQNQSLSQPIHACVTAATGAEIRGLRGICIAT